MDEIEKLNIDDYINNEEIEYITIPLIPTNFEYKFLEALEHLDDPIDAFTKYSKQLIQISIVLPHKFQRFLENSWFDSEGDIDDYEDAEIEETILNKIYREDLIKIGHSAGCPINITKETVRIFEGRKNQIYLKFENAMNYQHDFPMFSFLLNNKTEKKLKLYLRNVLVKNFKFNISISSIFNIKSTSVNFIAKEFIPNISRDNFDVDSSNEINYIIGKAIHIAIYDKLDLTTEEKETLKKFINTFYTKKTDYEKFEI